MNRFFGKRPKLFLKIFTFKFSFQGPLIQSSEIKSLLQQHRDDLRLLDCSTVLDITKYEVDPNQIIMKYPASIRDVKIKGAIELDLHQLSDKKNHIPFMFPSDEDFSKIMNEKKIHKDNLIICYDQYGMMFSPRVWFIFKAFGFENVYILNGGLPALEKESISLENRRSNLDLNNIDERTPSYQYLYKRKEGFIFSLENIMTLSQKVCREQNKSSIIDMREIEEEEIKEGVEALQDQVKYEAPKRSIAGADRIPYSLFFNEDKTFISKEDLLRLFESMQVNIEHPPVFFCDYGILSCTGILAFELLGKKSFLYDGSWAEYPKKNIGNHSRFVEYRDQIQKQTVNEMTDNLFKNLPPDQQLKIKLQDEIVIKVREMERKKRDFVNEKEKKKYNDDYDEPENLY